MYLEEKIDKLILAVELLTKSHEELKRLYDSKEHNRNQANYYSLEEVKKIFGANNHTLKAWHVSGKLRQIKPGGEKSRKIYYYKPDVDNLLN